MLKEIKYNKTHFFFLQYWPLLFFTYDFIAKVLITYNISVIYYYAIVFKSSIFIYSFSSFYLTNYKYHLYKNFFFRCVLLLVIFFLIGHLAILKYLTIDSLNYSFYYLLNSILPILLVPVYFSNKVLLKKTIKIFIVFLSFNFLFILIGFLLELEIFRSYFRSESRFGYMGLLLYHWEAGYLYFAAAFIAQEYYEFTKKYIYLFCFFFSMAALIFLGTKKGIFLAILYGIYLIIIKRRFLIKQYKILLVILFLILGFSRQIFNNLFKLNWDLFYKIYTEKGFIASFSSNRFNILIKKLHPVLLEKWNSLNYIFGGPLFSQFKSELELVDLIICFGFLGLLVYFMLIKRIFVNRKIRVLTILLIIAAVFAGNFFSSINVISFYLLIIIFLDYGNKIVIYK